VNQSGDLTSGERSRVTDAPSICPRPGGQKAAKRRKSCKGSDADGLDTSARSLADSIDRVARQSTTESEGNIRASALQLDIQHGQLHLAMYNTLYGSGSSTTPAESHEAATALREMFKKTVSVKPSSLHLPSVIPPTSGADAILDAPAKVPDVFDEVYGAQIVVGSMQDAPPLSSDSSDD
jgi:hypothetical protein